MVEAGKKEERNRFNFDCCDVVKKAKTMYAWNCRRDCNVLIILVSVSCSVSIAMITSVSTSMIVVPDP